MLVSIKASKYFENKNRIYNGEKKTARKEQEHNT